MLLDAAGREVRRPNVIGTPCGTPSPAAERAWGRQVRALLAADARRHGPPPPHRG
ncbi:MAG: hypothetical protein AB7R33_06330 [Thermoleophilia bacterium]